MTADDHPEAGGRGIEVQIVDVVDDIDHGAGGFGNSSRGKLRCPRLDIHVPTYRDHRRQAFERGKNIGLTDIAGMDDQLRAAQSVECFGTEQSMRIGDESELQAYGSSTMGARGNANFLPVASTTLTWQMYCPGVSLASGT